MRMRWMGDQDTKVGPYTVGPGDVIELTPLQVRNLTEPERWERADVPAPPAPAVEPAAEAVAASAPAAPEPPAAPNPAPPTAQPAADGTADGSTIASAAVATVDADRSPPAEGASAAPGDATAAMTAQNDVPAPAVEPPKSARRGSTPRFKK